MNDRAYIEQAIREYHKVVLISEGFGKNFDGEVHKRVKITSPKILILSIKQFDIKEKQFVFKQIDKETANKLYMLYHTYEFADNFILTEENSAYATILNYVRTGTLTEEEAWQALLGE